MRTKPLLGSACLLAFLAVASAGQLSSLFEASGDFELAVAGTVDPQARIFQNQAGAAILVLSDQLPQPVVLFVRSRRVQAVPVDRLRESGGSYSIVRGDPLVALGGFEVARAEVLFHVGDVEVKLRPRPPLVGERRLRELLEHSPEYRVRADAFEPDPRIVARLRDVQRDVRVRVVFGSWCHVCQNYLPRGLKLEEELAGGAVRFEYFGLPLEDPWEHAEVKRLEVKALPTAVVYVDGREVGRYVGAEGWTRPEESLLRAIESAGG